ncbi:hypothetical protein [Paenarthrobacter sp. FR1]|uniref:hypothetical protein n=1 Tax=Paenarthrobacter sp. FR1 TaxID=3439548 RepID=UPI003DA4D343
MDATPLNTMVLTVVFAAIALYALYFVIRSGVRDGILLADKKRGTVDTAEHNTDG